MKTALKSAAVILVAFLLTSCEKKEVTPQSVYYYQSPKSPSDKPDAANVWDNDTKIKTPDDKVPAHLSGYTVRNSDRTQENESENKLN